MGEHIFDQEQGFAAGSPEDRYSDLKKMVFNDEIKMIWCSSGGFAITQLWPLIEKEFIEKLRSNPKIIMGYSDICILLHMWFCNGVGSLHGPNLAGLSDLDEESIAWTKKILFNETDKKEPLISDGVTIREGKGVGRLLCSNLDSLVACFGTKYDPLDGEGDLILGIEEFEQFKSDIQRQIDMIMGHKRADRIKGFILGKFRNLKFDEEYSDWYVKNETWEIIAKRIAAVNKDIPVITWSNFGHIGDKFIAFKNGIVVEMISNADKSTLAQI
jgi:muramoyltetrapeptide carboxypeptidase